MSLMIEQDGESSSTGTRLRLQNPHWLCRQGCSPLGQGYVKRPDEEHPLPLRSLGLKGGDLVQTGSSSEISVSRGAYDILGHSLFKPSPRGTLYLVLLIPVRDLLTDGYHVRDLPTQVIECGYELPTLDIVMPLARELTDDIMDQMVPQCLEVIIPRARFKADDFLEPVVSIHRVKDDQQYRIDARRRPSWEGLPGSGIYAAVLKGKRP